MRNYRSNTNRLANLKNNPVVKAAIQRDKDIKTTQRSANIFYGIGASLLIPGGPLAGIGKKAIGQAFKKAGTAGNRKPADTVGNRLKQAQGIMGTSRTGKSLMMKELPVKLKNEFILKQNQLLSKAGMSTFKTKRIAPTFADRKIDRTLTSAVKQGPAKFFSKPKSPKTGVAAGKRKAQRFHPMDQEDMFGMSNSTSLFHNKDLVKETLKANRLAREKLKKK